MPTAGVIGKDGRSSAICRKLERSGMKGIPLGAWKGPSPGIAYAETLAAIKKNKVDFVVVGPEVPLAAGIVDLLKDDGIPCVGPGQAVARLETSKAFTRELLRKYDIPGNPKYRVFRDAIGIASFLRELGEYVIKPDGLTGGKGVKVSGDHLRQPADAEAYCDELFREGHDAVVIEERLDGEEFSLQSFCDGTTLIDMPVVQDHKRAWDNDVGPNTGGMGSYSCANHNLPFLTHAHLRHASAINELVARAVREETGEPYKGVLYGGFMLTREGVRLIEYNARFGDPEALNVLSILRTDFGRICEAIIQETLSEIEPDFYPLATVCKYVVPNGYPSAPVKGERLDLTHVPDESESLQIYPAAVEQRDGEVYLTGSRAIAFVGIHTDLSHAARIAEEAAAAVVGPVYHRTDIGSHELVMRRVAHIQSLSKSAGQREVHA